MAGARLRPINQGWADIASRGNAHVAEAGAITGAGTAAFGQGIAQGLANLTTGLLRKQAQKREDAQIAKADARYEESRQDRKDEYFLTAALKERATLQAQMDAETSAAQAGMELGVEADPAAMSRVSEVRERYEAANAKVATLEGRLMSSRKAKGPT